MEDIKIPEKPLAPTLGNTTNITEIDEYRKKLAEYMKILDNYLKEISEYNREKLSRESEIRRLASTGKIEILTDPSGRLENAVVINGKGLFSMTYGSINIKGISIYSSWDEAFLNLSLFENKDILFSTESIFTYGKQFIIKNIRMTVGKEEILHGDTSIYYPSILYTCQEKN